MSHSADIAATAPHTAVVVDDLPAMDRAKVGMAAFLLSEAAFFSTLVVAYVVYMGQDASGPTPGEVLKLPIAVMGTGCLLASSVTIHMAIGALRRANRGAFLAFWMATILFGVAFLLGTAIEWTALIGAHGLTIGRNLFGTTYFTLVGFHAAHVTLGVMALSVVFGLVVLRRLPDGGAVAPQVVSYYWHFVDGVWIVVFTVVYLVSTNLP
jgi:cytochrome c oxidase subunit 3